MASLADRKNPGLFSIVLGSVMSVALGALLACVHLAARPVEVVKALPKEPKANALYFVKGAPGGGAGKSWQFKRDALAEGLAGEFALTESELNAWAEATFEPAKVEDSQKGSTVTIIAGVPNFRIDGSALQVGLVNTLNFFGAESPLVIQARGGFEKSGSGWRFQATEARLGGLPLHRIPALVPLVAARFGASQAPVEVEKMLASAREIAVRDGSLVVALP